MNTRKDSPAVCRRMGVLLALSFLLALTGCRHPEPPFTLTGHIPALADDTLLVFGLDALHAQTDTVVAADGQFVYSFPADTVIPLCLLFPDGYREYIFADRSLQVSVSGDSASADMLTVSGGRQNELWQSFSRTLRDSMMMPKQRTMFIRQWIAAHPFDEASILVFERCLLTDPSVSGNELREAVSSMSGNLQDNNRMVALQPLLAASRTPSSVMPSFSLRDSLGHAYTSQQWRDTCLLVTFWASWDSVSRQRHRECRQLLDKYRRRPFAVVGVSLDADRGKWLQAIGEDTLTWTQTANFEGWELQMLQQLQIADLPANVLIGANRRVKATNVWGTALETKIREALEEQEHKTAENKKLTKRLQKR